MERKNDEIWRRIDQIRQYFCDGNNIEFAIKLNKEPSYTSQICNGTKSAGKKILDLILATFPQVSRTWLILGEGQMLSTSTPASEPTAKLQRTYPAATIHGSHPRERAAENGSRTTKGKNCLVVGRDERGFYIAIRHYIDRNG